MEVMQWAVAKRVSAGRLIGVGVGPGAPDLLTCARRG
jgi:hypothetical protein